MEKAETENEAAPGRSPRADVARYERGHAGLHRAFAPRDRATVRSPGAPLNGRPYIAESKKTGAKLIATVPYLLGGCDESVLLTLLSMAAQVRDAVSGATIAGCVGVARTNVCARVVTTRYGLLCALGWNQNAKDRDRLMVCLSRLAKVTIDWSCGRETGSAPLLQWAFSGGKVETLDVMVNWRLAGALVDDDFCAYVRISLVERRQLRGEVAQCLHRYLSFLLRPVEVGTVNIDTLVSRVFDEGPISPKAAEKRRYKIREALDQVRSRLGWGVSLSADRRQATIERAKIPTPSKGGRRLLPRGGDDSFQGEEAINVEIVETTEKEQDTIQAA